MTGATRPLLSESMVVDDDCPRRLARGGGWGTARLLTIFLLSALPAAVLTVFARHFLISDDDSPKALVAAFVVGVVVFVVIGGVVVLLAGRLTSGSGMEGMYRRVMPPGSTLRVDYFGDRLVVTSAGAPANEVPYASVTQVRVHKRVVILDRGRGAAALPSEVVPAAAVDLLRRGGHGPNVSAA